MRQLNDNHFFTGRTRDLLGLQTNLASISVIIAIGVLLSLTAGSASAATQVRGQPNDLQITVQNVSIREILDALSTKFKLTYKLPPGITGSRSGLYSGTLHQALARILDGNDYFVELSDGSVKVVVLGASGKVADALSNAKIAASARTVAPRAPAKPATFPKPTSPASKSSPPPLSTYLSPNRPATAGR